MIGLYKIYFDSIIFCFEYYFLLEIFWMERPSTVQYGGDFPGGDFKRERQHNISEYLLCIYAGIEALENMAIVSMANNLITYFISLMHYPLAESSNMITNYMGYYG